MRDSLIETDDSSETATESRASRERDDDLRCAECGGLLVTDDGRGETVCEDCGLVAEEDAIDRGPEWRAYGPGENDEKARVGSPTTKMLHDDGLSTNIGWRDEDANGNSLSNSQRRTVNRLRTWNERFRTRDSKERNLKQALGEIDRMASALGLPDDVREMASVIYRRALEEDLLPGRSIEGVATASLYAAARQANTPRSLDEMTTVSRISKDEITRTYRYVVRQLGLEVRPADPASYVPRFASELGLTEAVQRHARQLLDDAAESGMTSGKSPVGLAAAAVYAASLLANEKTTQQEVGDVASISEVTIRNRYNELLHAGTDLPGDS